MLRATAWTHGRRGAFIGTSAAVACLGAVLGACGGGSGDGGYVAVGPAGGSSGVAVQPTGEVRVVPLEGAAPSSSSSAVAASPSAAAQTPAASTPGSGAPSSSDGTDSRRTPTSSPSVESPAASPGPAVLTVSEPERAAGDQRWCEKVTLVFRNSGGSAVRSGTVTFGTHIIGALGIDWGTVESEVALPAPVGAGERTEKTWTVCVDTWRVPLGMHIETRDVDVRWE
ncbi:hypothetical protein [Streptomyces sp. NPDC046909]|uniref:hypothetical protein n=1 Tax=Streptomyces sp. NPDC046909 TaxID=3155617 RepID=UPI00340C87A3